MFILCPLFISAQGISINNSNTPADASAILDISSLQKGVLFPRMNTMQRSAIVLPAQGLMVYDTDTRSYWFYDNNWKEMAVGGPLILPYATSIASNVNLFDITNTSGAPGSAVIKGKQTNAGSGINIPLSIGVWGDNSNGGGVAGTSNSGIGTYGVSNSNHGVWGSTNGANYAGVYGTTIINDGIGVLGEINQIGTAVLGRTQGPHGRAGHFLNTQATNILPAIEAENAGVGHVMKLTNATNSEYSALRVENNGTGAGIYIVNNHPTATAASLWINTFSQGHGIVSVTPEPTNPFPAIGCHHVGSAPGISASSNLGIAGLFENDNVDNLTTVLRAFTPSRGIAATFQKTNVSGSISDIHDPCVLIDNFSKGAGLKIVNDHSVSVNPAIDVEYTGEAVAMNIESSNNGIFVTASGDDESVGVFAQNTSGGIGIKGVANASLEGAVIGENMADTGYGVKGIGHGYGGIGVLGMSESSSNALGSITGINNAPNIGCGVYGESYGIYSNGVKGRSTGGDGSGVYGENTAGGFGVLGESTGSYPIGVRGVAHPDGFSNGIGVLASSTGNGYGLSAYSGNNGAAIIAYTSSSTNSRAGYFQTNNSNNSMETFRIENDGTGKSLNIICTNNNNSSPTMMMTKSGTGDFVIFEAGNGDNKIRFDNTGKGFFNGGTQNSGADIAESFDVENEIDTYEPGDVLVISLESDRTVTKSTAPYSTLVAGVYATKPGVLLTENEIEADLSDEVPMGVVGVIPTKVCLEGGVIQRGDFIVTSSLPGVAMKGDPDKVKIGQVIGKALENYDAEGVGKIKVLVSVK